MVIILNCAGENVQDFFFRVMCLNFDCALLRELETDKPASKQIGNDLISKGPPHYFFINTFSKRS